MSPAGVLCVGLVVVANFFPFGLASRLGESAPRMHVDGFHVAVGESPVNVRGTVTRTYYCSVDHYWDQVHVEEADLV